jgi:alanine racemase
MRCVHACLFVRAMTWIVLAARMNPKPDPRRPPAPTLADCYATLTIDVGAIVANWRDLVARAAPAECAAVVKADAYGCGLEPVADALREAGCRAFFVAHLSEAQRLRAVSAGAVIYVLNGLPPGHAPAFAKGNFRPILGSLAEIEEWQAFRAATHWTGGAALQIDTGMSRLGLSLADAAELARRPAGKRSGIDLLLSHFACSEQPGHPLNAQQMSRFREVRSLFPSMRGSLANSSGIFLGPDAHHDLVRPGAALYGVNPTPDHLNPMRSVATLEGRIVQVREIDAGETVGYGATWTARRPSRLAIVSIGYADGFPRASGGTDLSPGADAIVAGHRCPLAGRVSMDLMAVDVTDLPDEKPQRGDSVALLNDEIGVDEVGSAAGTIGYEVLTRLGARYRRVYVGG